MGREPISKIKNGKVAGPSGIVSEMIKPAKETGLDLIRDLVYQSIIEGVIPAE